MNAAQCNENEWDKTMRAILVLCGLSVIAFITVAEAIFANFSLVSLLARLNGFYWGYYIADLFWSKTGKYNYGIREEWDE